MSDLSDNPVVYHHNQPRIGFSAEKTPNGGWVVCSTPAAHEIRVILAAFSNSSQFLAWLHEELREGDK